MKNYWGVKVQFHALLTSAGSFTPRVRTSSTHWAGGCLDPRTGLDAVAKRKIPSKLNPGRPACSLVSNTDLATAALNAHQFS